MLIIASHGALLQAFEEDSLDTLLLDATDPAQGSHLEVVLGFDPASDLALRLYEATLCGVDDRVGGLDDLLQDGDVDGGWNDPRLLSQRVDALHHVVEALELEATAEQVSEYGEDEFGLLGVEVLTPLEEVEQVVEDSATQLDAHTVELLLIAVGFLAARILHLFVSLLAALHVVPLTRLALTRFIHHVCWRYLYLRYYRTARLHHFGVAN